jgi:hypothetical protein
MPPSDEESDQESCGKRAARNHRGFPLLQQGRGWHRPPVATPSTVGIAISRPACGHHRFYAAVLSPRPRAVAAQSAVSGDARRDDQITSVRMPGREPCNRCRFNDHRVPAMVCGRPTGQLTRRFKAKLFNRFRETAECMAGDGRQKPCLCPSSRRSLTRSVIPAPRRPSPP